MPLRHRAGVPELVPRLCPVSLAFAQAGMDFPGAGHALGHAEDGPAGAKRAMLRRVRCRRSAFWQVLVR